MLLWRCLEEIEGGCVDGVVVDLDLDLDLGFDDDLDADLAFCFCLEWLVVEGIGSSSMSEAEERESCGEEDILMVCCGSGNRPSWSVASCAKADQTQKKEKREKRLKMGIASLRERHKR